MTKIEPKSMKKGSLIWISTHYIREKRKKINRRHNLNCRPTRKGLFSTKLWMKLSFLSFFRRFSWGTISLPWNLGQILKSRKGNAQKLHWYYWGWDWFFKQKTDSHIESIVSELPFWSHKVLTSYKYQWKTFMRHQYLEKMAA